MPIFEVQGGVLADIAPEIYQKIALYSATELPHIALYVDCYKRLCCISVCAVQWCTFACAELRVCTGLCMNAIFYF